MNFFVYTNLIYVHILEQLVHLFGSSSRKEYPGAGRLCCFPRRKGRKQFEGVKLPFINLQLKGSLGQRVWA